MITAEELIKQMTLEEKAAFCSGRDFWKTKEIKRLGIPSVMMCDGPHGLRKQEGEADHLGINESIKTVCYPTASALAASFDRDAMKRLGEALGRECQAEHVAMLLGPGLNIKRSPLCGRNFEYFSEDPYLAGQMGAAYVKGLQSKGVAACAKHFACNDQETRRSSGSSQVDERTLHEIYLPAFENVVKEGKTRSIMCAYNAINGTYCAENKMLLNDILRDEWGYEGFVVTDWGAIKDRARCIMAGLDLEMPGTPLATGEQLVQAVKDGTLPEADLDKAVLRLLEFVCEALQNQQENAAIDRDECRKLARELSGECAVLMKNDSILPLSDRQKVAFIGEFAMTPRYQGAGSSHINVPHPVSAYAAAEGKAVSYVQGYDLHSGKTDEVLLHEAVETAKCADVAVVFAGLPDAFETEGADRRHMRLPDNQNELIAAVATVNPHNVVVLHGGAPVELPWLDQAEAVLCMYLCGDQVGAATVDLLYGKVNPSGHLAETWPIRLEDNPSYLNFPGEDGIVTYAEGIYVGYRYYDKRKMAVNFPFGHGLSYTRFEYSDLKLSADRINDTDTLTVRFTVKNTGSVSGKTAAQLYVSDAASTVRRPVRELKGFEKVSLNPGESKEVSFTLNQRSFAYWEPKIHDWFVETGDFRIEIGESSRDIRLDSTVIVTATKELPFIIDRNTPIAKLMKYPKGAAAVREMMGQSGRDHESGDSQVTVLGEVDESLLRQMMEETPLGYAVLYGRITDAELDALMAELNAKGEN